jgi:hypothetical protein
MLLQGRATRNLLLPGDQISLWSVSPREILRFAAATSE